MNSRFDNASKINFFNYFNKEKRLKRQREKIEKYRSKNEKALEILLKKKQEKFCKNLKFTQRYKSEIETSQVSYNLLQF